MKNKSIKKNIFGIISGDKRQLFLADSLKKDGYEVYISGFSNELFKEFDFELDDLDKVIKKSNIIVLPMPVTRDSKKLLLSNIDLNNDFFNKIKNKKIFCAAKKNITNNIWRSMNIIDYLDDEDFNVLNSSPTAEGAIKIAMDNSNITIRDSKCMVVGFGRIGKILSNLLKKFGANVYITPNSVGDESWAKILNYNKIYVNKEKKLNFDFIFNTVPKLIFDKSNLNKVSKKCLIIDLASVKGIDFEYAKKIGIKALHELGVPGRFFPKTAAEIIKKTIYSYL